MSQTPRTRPRARRYMLNVEKSIPTKPKLRKLEWHRYSVEKPPMAKSLEPDAKNQTLRARGQEPDTKSQTPRSGNQEPDTKSQTPRARNQEPDTKSQTPRA